MATDTQYKGFNRFTETDYAEVIAELHRPDCVGTDVIQHLPKENDVEKVLSDLGQVRYILYTAEYIYMIHIETTFNCSTTQIEELCSEWDLLIFKR